jgi:1,2-diacylglycerol 3-alpha-glucosyltransferase
VPFEPNATRRAASQLTRTFANLADAVVVPTPAMTARLREIGVTTRIEVVPSGIDVAAFGRGKRDEELRERAGAGSGDRLILGVSRLGKEKNVEVLFEALALTTDARLKRVIAGDGPAREELESRAAACGVSRRTRFLGSVAREQLPDLYASADAFAMPSTTETQGLVQAEALAAGTLVIAADTPQNREVLGGAGHVIPATPEAFARAFLELPERAGEAASRRARKAAQRFAVDRQVDRMLDLYQSLLPGAPGVDRERMFAIKSG